MGQVPTEQPARDQVHKLCGDILVATAENIDHLAREFIGAIGTPAEAALLLASKQFQVAPRGSAARATQLGMAHIIEVCAGEPGALSRLVHLQGNMYWYFEADVGLFGAFLVKYPEAACAVPSWSQAARPSQATQLQEVVASCVKLLSVDGAQLQQDQLLQRLCNPVTIGEFTDALVQAAKKSDSSFTNQDHLTALAAALVTSTDLQATLRQLHEHNFNLYAALDESHFGRALTTSLLSWDLVKKWTAGCPTSREQSGTSEAGQSTDPLRRAPRDSHGQALSTLGKELTGYERVRAQRQQQRQQQQGLLREDYEDLRLKHPPVDPQLHEQGYAELIANPINPQARICKFTAPNMQDVRERRWLWWMSLGRIRLFVKELYAFTAHEGKCNAGASGNVGQEVIRCAHGTLTWVPNDHRIVVANSSTILQARVAAAYPEWNPSTDMARRYHHNRIPQQITQLLAAQDTALGFQ